MQQLDKSKFIEARLQGKNKTESALIAGASNKLAAQKAGYRLSKDLDVKKQVSKALKRHDIKIDTLIQVYAEALKAEKTDRITGEITIDHSTRMRASDKFMDLLGINTRPNTETATSHNISQQSNTEILGALKSGDEVELQRAVFRKAED